MPRLRTLLVPAALLATLACQPRSAAPVIYGPWEEGLTLAYEDPSRPQPRRSEDRLQVRVARSVLGPGAPGLVQLDLTTVHGQLSLRVQHSRGGLTLVGDDGRPLSQLLPPGFPTASAWTDRGIEFHVLGRATWEGAALLPATSDPVGVWVEARTPQGLRRRTLYLPDLGEVESREERGGSWVVVNRLVARGFTDLPAFHRP